MGPGLRVVRTLGIGGMGVVLLVHDEVLQRNVAAKLVHPHLLASDEARAAFQAEAQAMARVRHPNVVEIFAFGEHDGRPFFTMEHVEGPPLTEYHARRGHQPIPFDEALRLLEGVAAGVAAIHDSGTVHGDLKPGNVLVDHQQRTRVADFGITRGNDELLGTPAYVAPERIARQSTPEYLPRIDVYAFGALTHELLTGRPPFAAPDVGRLYAQHLYKPPPKTTEERPDLPPEVDDVLAAALAKDPAERPSSVLDVLDGLLMARRAMRPSRRVLIADDDPEMRLLVRAYLEVELDVDTIEEVDNGRDALRLLAARHFDLAVIDLHMPHMNGLELTASIRERIAAADLRIVVVSGHGRASDWRVLSQLGADAFVVKPIEPEVFIATVEPLLYG